jgi:FMN-dependent NADH-azoreductase
VLTSGVYAQDVPSSFGVDRHSTHLRAWLNEAGVTQIDELRFRPSLLTPDRDGGFDKARERAVEPAAAHGRV